MSPPAAYRSGTPRDQHPAIARWHTHLHGLATLIHETSGLANDEGNTMDSFLSCLGVIFAGAACRVDDGQNVDFFKGR